MSIQLLRIAVHLDVFRILSRTLRGMVIRFVLIVFKAISEAL